MNEQVPTVGKYVRHVAYTTVMGLKAGAVGLASKLNRFTKEDATFLKVLGFTVVAIGGLIVLKRLVEHLKPLEQPVVTPPPPPASPAHTQGLHFHNGVWGWGNRG